MERLAKIALKKLSAYFSENKSSVKAVLQIATEILPAKMENSDIEAEEEELFYSLGYEFKDSLKAEILKAADVNKISRTAFELALCKAITPSVSQLIEAVMIDNGQGVTIETAAYVSGIRNLSVDYLSEMREAYEALKSLMLPEFRRDKFYHEPLIIDGRLLSFLFEKERNNEADSFINDLITIDEYTAEIKLYGITKELEYFAGTIKETLREMSEDENNSDYLRVVIEGEKGSGRYLLSRWYAAKCRRRLISIDFSEIAKDNFPMNRLMRECFLQKAWLCVRNVTKSENYYKILEKIQKNYYLEDFPETDNRRAIFFTCENNVKCIPASSGPVLSIDTAAYLKESAEQIWKNIFEDSGLLEEYDYEQIVSLISMTPDQIKKVAANIWSISKGEARSIDQKEFYGICYRVLDDGRYENVHRVEPGYTLEDLKVSPKIRELVEDIRDQVLYRRRVYSKWGMSEKYAYGRCISLLLSGPPGTGKTMLVHALADALSLELYKVDLSQLIDKYVGETEKRINEVFEKAQKSNMILFFDEADAVMGKRTDASDARDKSSNAQIAFILQRIEEFDGIVILATNLQQNMDKAFMRRIRYYIRFDFPDKEIRESIWRNAFSEGVPLDKDIDFEYLAESFELTGAVIRNIVLNAAFLAAAKDDCVRMEHIMKSIIRESSKDAGILSNADMQEWQYLM